MKLLRTAALAACLHPLGAIAIAQNDLREFRVGLPVSELPTSGYSGFICGDDPSKALAAWADFQSCPVGSDGTRTIGFRYGAGDEDGKTQVGGQPVKIALLINDENRVTAIRIDTDPHARLYLRKKAHLFALQVRARFGEDGWTCQQTAPTPTEQPVGGVFVHEHCEKTTPTRHFVLNRELFRDPAKDLREFTDATQLTIRYAGDRCCS